MAQERIFYAIGDIHGEAVRLQNLHAHIDDFHQTCYPEAVKHLVHLGDYVDRGPDSKGVIDLLIARQTAFPDTTTCLMGNHEEMMLDAHQGRNPNFWQRNGGEETLQSYGVQAPADLPKTHLEWIEALPTTFTPEDTNVIFVHAGVDPRIYPYDDEMKRRWMRGSRFFDTSKWESLSLQGKRVVHGHTPTESGQPDVSLDGRRINVDTGAAYGGALTAAVLRGFETPVFLQT